MQENADSARLPVQSPLATEAPEVVPRPNSTLSQRSRVLDEQVPTSSDVNETEVQARFLEEVTYNDKVVSSI